MLTLAQAEVTCTPGIQLHGPVGFNSLLFSAVSNVKNVAGYGRKEAAEMLLEAGADPLVKNAAGQAPADAARANREMHMVKFLKSRGGEKSTQGSKYL